MPRYLSKKKVKKLKHVKKSSKKNNIFQNIEVLVLPKENDIKKVRVLKQLLGDREQNGFPFNHNNSNTISELQEHGVGEENVLEIISLKRKKINLKDLYNKVKNRGNKEVLKIFKQNGVLKPVDEIENIIKIRDGEPLIVPSDNSDDNAKSVPELSVNEVIDYDNKGIRQIWPKELWALLSTALKNKTKTKFDKTYKSYMEESEDDLVFSI